MNWNNEVWLYCERGAVTGWLVEPLNLLSNLLMIGVPLIIMWIYHKRPYSGKSADKVLLIALAFFAGLGSLAFHLFASQWSELAHMVPFILFLLVYLSFAAHEYLELPPGGAALALIVLLVLTVAGLTMTCQFLDAVLQPAWVRALGQNASVTSCLNGAGGYLPIALAFVGLGWFLRLKRHEAAAAVLLAALLFFASRIFQAVDHLACNLVAVNGHAIGTHFISHVLDAGVLFFLLYRLVMTSKQKIVQEILPPSYQSRAKSHRKTR